MRGVHTSWEHQELLAATKARRESWNRLPSVPPEGTNLAHTLTWDFGSSEL